MKAEDILELTGQEIDPNVLTIHPTGNLVHVLLEPPPEEFGLIKIPDTIVNNEKMGVGYIIAAGPRAGHDDYAGLLSGAIGVIAEEPEDLLGLHVIFASHAGVPLRVSMMDREFRAPVLIFQSKDMRGVDTNPVPLTTRVTERMKE